MPNNHDDLGFVPSGGPAVSHADLGFVPSGGGSKSVGATVRDSLGSVFRAIDEAYHGGLGAVGDALGVPKALGALGVQKSTPEEAASFRNSHQTSGGILTKDSPDWLAAADSFVAGMPGADQGVPNPEHQARAAKFANENPGLSLGLGVAGGGAYPAPGGVKGGPITSRLESAAGGLENAAETTAARVAGGTANQYRAAGPEKVRAMGKLLMDEKVLRPGNLTTRGVAKELPGLVESTGNDLSSSIEALDNTGLGVSKRDALERFLELADKERSPGSSAKSLRAKYLSEAGNVMDDIGENGPNMSFSQAEKWKRDYQRPINYAKANNSVPEMGAKEIASASRQAVEDAAARAAKQSGDPSLESGFLANKERSGLAQTANEMAEGAQGRAEARSWFGPTTKVAGYLGGGVALAHGNIPGAMAAVTVPPLLQAAKNRAFGATALSLRGTSDMLMRLAATQPETLGRFAGILRPALQQGQDLFAAAQYTLGQTDPEFQALTKKLGEQK